MEILTKPWGKYRPARKVDRASPLLDAFGRLRVSNPDTIFDSKLTIGKYRLPLGIALEPHNCGHSSMAKPARISGTGLEKYRYRNNPDWRSATK